MTLDQFYILIIDKARLRNIGRYETVSASTAFARGLPRLSDWKKEQADQKRKQELAEKRRRKRERRRRAE